MVLISPSSSRKEKENFLKEVIQSLSISQSEKDLYSLCIEVLEGADFDVFFQKIS
jgi:hypothetical protein